MQNTLSSRIVTDALASWKESLQHHYEEAYPGLSEIIHLVLDEEEARARELSDFPHLLLPDLVGTHLARLGLQPVELQAESIFTPAPSGPLKLVAA